MKWEIWRDQVCAKNPVGVSEGCDHQAARWKRSAPDEKRRQRPDYAKQQRDHKLELLANAQAGAVSALVSC